MIELGKRARTAIPDAGNARTATLVAGGAILAVLLVAWRLSRPTAPALSPPSHANHRARVAEPALAGSLPATSAAPCDEPFTQRSEVARADDDAADGWTLRGVVVDERGTAVDGAAIEWVFGDLPLARQLDSSVAAGSIESASEQAIRRREPPAAGVETDAAGRFELPGLPSGFAPIVSAVASPARQVTVPLAADAREVCIVLPRLGSIAGQLRVGPGVLAEELVITVSPQEGGPAAEAWTFGGFVHQTAVTAAADGRFELRDVPVGRWNLRVDHLLCGLFARVGSVVGVASVAEQAPPDPRLDPFDLSDALRRVTVEVVTSGGAPVDAGWWTLARAADGRVIGGEPPLDALAHLALAAPAVMPFTGGRFALTVPSASLHRVHVAVPGHRIAAAELSAPHLRVAVGSPAILRVALDLELRELMRLAPASLMIEGCDRWSVQEFQALEACFDADGRAELLLPLLGWLAPKAFMRASHEAELSSWIKLEPFEVGESIGHEWIELRRAR